MLEPVGCARSSFLRSTGYTSNRKKENTGEKNGQCSARADTGYELEVGNAIGEALCILTFFTFYLHGGFAMCA